MSKLHLPRVWSGEQQITRTSPVSHNSQRTSDEE
jgi:hypothetical protein